MARGRDRLEPDGSRASGGQRPGKCGENHLLLQRLADFAVFNAVYEKHFPGRPARSCVEAAALPKGALVEIEAVAYLAE